MLVLAQAHLLEDPTRLRHHVAFQTSVPERLNSFSWNPAERTVHCPPDFYFITLLQNQARRGEKGDCCRHAAAPCCRGLLELGLGVSSKIPSPFVRGWMQTAVAIRIHGAVAFVNHLFR